MRHATLRSLLLLPLLLTLGCNYVAAEIGLPEAGGGLPVTIPLQPGVAPEGVTVALDGQDVTALFAPGPGGLHGTLPLPAPGAHELQVVEPQVVLLGEPLLPLTLRKAFVVPAAAPALRAFAPAPTGGALAQTAWLQLSFEAEVPAAALHGFGFALACEGAPLARAAYRIEGRSVLLDPAPRLPAGACRVLWRGPGGVEERRFTVASLAADAPAAPIYDRSSPMSLAPFPDDWWTVPDASTTSGLRLAFAGPPFGDGRDAVLDGIEASVNGFDGWSPVGPIILSFSHAVERSLLPQSESESQDPFAPVSIFDLDPSSPSFGARIPYRVEPRDDGAPDGSTDHALMLFPAITLRPGGQYAVVVSRRLLAAGDASRPFEASAFFSRAAGAPAPEDDAATQRIRSLVSPVLDFLEATPAVPVPREDVALALRVSIRSLLRDPTDLLAIKEDALTAAPPVLTVETTTSTSRRTLVVRGKIALPDYLGTPDGGALTRDPATGRPKPWRDEPVPFVMTLPAQAAAGPVPIVIYQHGSPGSPEEILGTNNEFLDDAGYALLGIQDTANRRFGADSAAQTGAILVHLIVNGRIPLLELQTHANLQYLLRALPAIAARDWLPAGAPDGQPELDATKILYRGISFGAHHSLGFLPFAPEVTAAVSVVGAGRFYENTLHQLDFFGVIPGIQVFLPTVRPIELLVGLAAIQNDEDLQDPHHLARHLYRERLPIAGIPAGAPPPSLLWLEGVGDNVVSNNATRAAARELGIPQVGHVRRASPVLEQVAAPLAGNVGPGRTAGHYQYEPAETPSCVASGQLEGHYCPQRATEAREQILHFFATALAGGAPEIVDPLP